MHGFSACELTVCFVSMVPDHRLGRWTSTAQNHLIADVSPDLEWSPMPVSSAALRAQRISSTTAVTVGARPGPGNRATLRLVANGTECALRNPIERGRAGAASLPAIVEADADAVRITPILGVWGPSLSYLRRASWAAYRARTLLHCAALRIGGAGDIRGGRIAGRCGVPSELAICAAVPYVQIDHLDPERTAMIVVDMENDFVAEGAPLETPAAREMVPKLAEALSSCRAAGIKVIYTTHLHRRDGSDLGLFRFAPPIADGLALAEGTRGVEIYAELAPRSDEHVIAKHRFSGFFGTDLDMILRGWGIDTVIISGTTTENCCHATARDALFRDYKVVFLSDATATFDYDDVGYGAMSAAEVHRATLVILASSTAHVMSVEDMTRRIASRNIVPD
jgi:biuret amidohydrolase